MSDEEETSAITFETFRKFQRKEKKNEKLQELPKDFFKKCVDWINEKQEQFDERRESALLRELENVKSIVSDIFERRRKKILILALHSVRSSKVSENLLPEEREFFESIVDNLKKLEENLLERVLKGKQPEEVCKEEAEETAEEETEETVEKEEAEETVEKEADEPEEDKGEVTSRQIGNEEPKRLEVETKDGYRLLRITEEVDRFVGTDGNEYGPLKKGDIATLPEDVSDLLIDKDIAKLSKI